MIGRRTSATASGVYPKRRSKMVRSNPPLLTAEPEMIACCIKLKKAKHDAVHAKAKAKNFHDVTSKAAGPNRPVAAAVSNSVIGVPSLDFDFPNNAFPRPWILTEPARAALVGNKERAVTRQTQNTKKRT